jgi:hypothetical protein
VKEHDGSDGLARLRKAELANEQVPIGGREFDIAPSRGKFGHRSNLGH